MQVFSVSITKFLKLNFVPHVPSWPHWHERGMKHPNALREQKTHSYNQRCSRKYAYMHTSVVICLMRK